MNMVGNIFLVGPMGAGKSTIGRFLANELKLEFRDTDQALEERTGADVSWIFDVEGEDGFRVREQKIIEELTANQGIVLATGGGAICLSDNRKFLGGRGFVVYLEASVDQQWSRTKRDKNRPLLQTENPRETLEALHADRDPLYREIADMVVETDGRTVRSVANEILRKLREM